MKFITLLICRKVKFNEHRQTRQVDAVHTRTLFTHSMFITSTVRQHTSCTPIASLIAHGPRSIAIMLRSSSFSQLRQ